MSKNKTSFFAAIALSLSFGMAVPSVTAQTIVGATNSTTTVQGSATNINGSYVNVNAPGAVTVTSPLLQVNGGEKITGNLSVAGYTTLSGPNTTIGGGSSTTNVNGYNTTIASTYTTISSSQTFITGSKVQLGGSGANVSVAGQTANFNSVNTNVTGNLNASGPVSLAGGVITNPSYSSGSAAIGAGAVVGNGVQNAIQIGAGSNTIANSVQIGNASTSTNVGGGLSVSGSVNVNNNVITGVKADWADSTSAANVSQLTTVRDTAAAATASVQSNLDATNITVGANTAAITTEVTRATSAEASLAATVETNATTAHAYTDASTSSAIAASATDATAKANAALTSANAYTDSKVSIVQSNLDTTNASISTEVSRAKAAETTLSNRTTVVEEKTTAISYNAQSSTTLVAGNLSVSNQLNADTVVARQVVMTSAQAGSLNVVGSTTTNGIDNNGKGITNAGTITGVTAGVIDTDAANVGQVRSAQAQANAYTDSKVGAEAQRAQAAEAVITKEVRQVGAMAMAASAVGSIVPAEGKDNAVGAAVGSYGGVAAISVGAVHLIREQNMRVFGSISAVNGGRVGAAVGAAFSF